MNEIMLINGTWQRASAAKVGDYLFNPLTGKNVTITSIGVSNTGGRVYDFIGTPVNNYIANGFLIDKDSTIVYGDGASSVTGNDTITLANGTTEPVSSLTVGTIVMSYSLALKKFVPSIVVSIKHVKSSNMYLINNNLLIDGGEDMIINGSNQPASMAKVGDTMIGSNGNTILITSVKSIKGIDNTYDINTAPVDTFLVNGYVIS